MDQETKVALLATPKDDCVEPEYIDWYYERNILRKEYTRRFAIIQVVLLFLYAAGVGIFFSGAFIGQRGGRGRDECFQAELSQISAVEQHGRSREEFVYTPADEVDKFQKTELNMHLYKDNPYKGPPSPEVDDAWDKLFTNSYIRLSGDELVKLGRNSTLIPDGSGDFMGALDVYHQLHCVRFIFEFVHQDYYTMKKLNIPDTDHIDHCIDVLRQVVMCLGDTSVSTLAFIDGYPQTWPEFKFEHSCRNWDAVDSWAGRPGRAVDQSDPIRMKAWLHNPNYMITGHQTVGIPKLGDNDRR